MKYFKDKKTGEVFAYETEAERNEWGSPDLVKMTETEIEAHLNPTPTTEQLANEARLWRDSELARADIELNKVQDDMGVGTVTQWRSYRVTLRDWPTTDGWPESTKPISPDYKE